MPQAKGGGRETEKSLPQSNAAHLTAPSSEGAETAGASPRPTLILYFVRSKNTPTNPDLIYRKAYIPYFFKSSVAGFSINLPSSLKRDPWQGQSQVCSVGFHFKAQPKCGQRFFVGVKMLVRNVPPLTAS